MNNFLNTFVPEKSTAVTMPIGSHDVVIKQIKEVDDHTRDLSGTAKEGYRFNDVHEQIAITFVRQDGKPGIITERFNTKGFKQFDAMSAKEQKKFHKDPGTDTEPSKGYALDKNNNRIEDPEKTEQCKSVFNQFVNQLQTSEGKLLIDEIAGKPFELNSLVGTRCSITVEAEAYGGKERNRITKYRRITTAPALVVDGVEQRAI